MYKFYLFFIITLLVFSIYVHKLNRDNEVLHNIRSRTLQKQDIEKLRLRRAIESEELTGWAWLKNKWRTMGDRLTLAQLPYDCNAILFERLNNKCCKLPQLIPPAVFDNCTVRNVSLSFRRRYNSYRRGPMCLYSCVFSELNLLEPTDEEELDLLAITTSFSQAVDDTWRKLVRDAIVSCNEALNENVTVSVLLTSFGQTCTVAPLLFMKCIKKTLILACPASIVKTVDEDCPKDMERLRGCNPFHLMHQNSSSAQLLMRRPETTPTTTPYRPPPRSRDLVPSPWSRPPGPPHGDSIVWHNKDGISDGNDLDSTTPMNYIHVQKTTEISKNKHASSGNTNLHYPSTESMKPNHERKNNNIHITRTTNFDEWKEVTEEINKNTRDIEDTTPRGALATHWRDKFIPRISHS